MLIPKRIDGIRLVVRVGGGCGVRLKFGLFSWSGNTVVCISSFSEGERWSCLFCGGIKESCWLCGCSGSCSWFSEDWKRS